MEARYPEARRCQEPHAAAPWTELAHQRCPAGAELLSESPGVAVARPKAHDDPNGSADQRQGRDTCPQADSQRAGHDLPQTEAVGAEANHGEEGGQLSQLGHGHGREGVRLAELGVPSEREGPHHLSRPGGQHILRKSTQRNGAVARPGRGGAAGKEQTPLQRPRGEDQGLDRREREERRRVAAEHAAELGGLKPERQPKRVPTDAHEDRRQHRAGEGQEERDAPGSQLLARRIAAG